MAPRKKEDVQVTKSREALATALATQVWGQVFRPYQMDAEGNPVLGEDGQPVIDTDNLGKNYQEAVDTVTVLISKLRDARDAARPVLRERKETEDVLEAAIGKPVSELQAAFITLPIAFDTEGNPTVTERVNLPSLKRFAEVQGHPFQEAAENFLKSHKLRFIQREKEKGKGKAATILESTDKKKAQAAA